jgi:tellurite resistance protein
MGHDLHSRMIIWGLRTIFRKIGEGLFHCPAEDMDRAYHLKVAQRFFTLFFIPIIPLKKHGEVVECQGCKAKFDKAVLDLPTNDQMTVHLADAVRHAVVAVAQADGEASPQEREAALRAVAQFRNDDRYEAAHLDEDLRLLPVHDVAGQMAAVVRFLNDPGRENVLRSIAGVALADGPITQPEQRILEAAGAGLGMTSAHISGVLSAVQQER